MVGMTKARAIIAGIASLLLTVGLARFAYTPLLPIMHAEAGLSLLLGGWLATFNYLGYLSGALLAAFTSSLQRKFLFYRLGLVLGLSSTAAMGLTQDPVAWAVLRYVAGVSGSAGMLLASGLIMHWLVRHGQRSELGLHFSGLGLGIVLSGILVGLMSSNEASLAWNDQWLLLGLAGTLLFIPAWFWMPRPQPSDAPSIVSAADESSAGHGRPWMAWLTTAYFCAGVGFAVSATFTVAILERLPDLAGHGGWVWLVVGLAAAPSSFLWDRVARRLDMVPSLILAYALHIVASATPLITTNPWLSLASAALFGGTFVGIVSLTLSLVGRRSPSNPSKAMARLTLSYGAGQILAPALAGAIANTRGDYLDSLRFATLLLVVGLVILCALHRRAVTH